MHNGARRPGGTIRLRPERTVSVWIGRGRWMGRDPGALAGGQQGRRWRPGSVPAGGRGGGGYWAECSCGSCGDVPGARGEEICQQVDCTLRLRLWRVRLRPGCRRPRWGSSLLRLLRLHCERNLRLGEQPLLDEARVGLVAWGKQRQAGAYHIYSYLVPGMYCCCTCT